MNADLEWVRLAFAMALMGTAFLGLPVFFLWNDKRKLDRQAALQDLTDPTDLTDLYNEREQAVVHWAGSPENNPIPRLPPKDLHR